MQIFQKPVGLMAVLAFGVGLSGCEIDVNIDGDGVPLSELEMSGATPDTLALAGPDRVILIEGETLDITVEGDDEAIEALRFDLDDSDLLIYREDGFSSSNGATIRVTMPAPREIDIGGSGNVEAARMSENAEINIGGSGSVSVAQIEAESLEVAIGGSGNATAQGTARALEIAIGGSGNVDFSGLTAETAEIAIGGSGDVRLASDGDVEASIAGSGDVRVTGNANCTLNSIGSGTLNCTPRNDEGGDEATEETGSDETSES
ncbi:MAG: head GIN domain-containing protein [Erythrobacter sp.]